MAKTHRVRRYGEARHNAFRAAVGNRAWHPAYGVRPPAVGGPAGCHGGYGGFRGAHGSFHASRGGFHRRH